MAYFRCGSGGGTKFLEQREYYEITWASMTKRTYTSGSRLSTTTSGNGISYIINVKNISGTLSVSGNKSDGSLGIYGLKDGNVTKITNKANSHSYSGTFSNYDYLVIIGTHSSSSSLIYCTITES